VSGQLTAIPRQGRVFKIVNYWRILLKNPPLFLLLLSFLLFVTVFLDIHPAAERTGIPNHH
jgi:hypothetical protein